MISRLEAKEAEVTYSTVRMVPLLTEIFESVEPIAAEYQVTLHKECEPVSIEMCIRDRDSCRPDC